MTSTRLPGKVLKSILGKPLLEYQLERLQRVKNSNIIVIATTVNPEDEPILELCKKLEVLWFRGSEMDVLSRYNDAAQAYDADVVVRVASDAPLIDPQIIDKLICFYLAYLGDYDYVSNILDRTYPRGMDAEVFSFKALHEAANEAIAQPDREHVTPFIYRHPERYRIKQLQYHEDQSRHRWTIDTPEDFELVRRMVEILYPRQPEFTLEDCLEVLEQHPNWYFINAHIRQKQYGE